MTLLQSSGCEYCASHRTNLRLITLAQEFLFYYQQYTPPPDAGQSGLVSIF